MITLSPLVAAPSAGLGGTDLASLVRDCTASGVERRVLLLRGDRLPPALSRPHHLRLLRVALDPLTTAERARFHHLPAGGCAVSWRGDASGLLRRAMAGLRHLLDDAGPDAPPLTDLVRLFDLPVDGPVLLRFVTRAEAPAAAPPSEAAPPETEASPGQPALDRAGLDTLVRHMAGADIARFARRDPVCRIDGTEVTLAWDTRFVRLDDLTRELTGRCVPRGDGLADAWLRRTLVRAVDQRLLALLAAPGELEGAGPFGIALDLGSILSAEFIRFDAALPPALRGQVTLAIDPSDMLADPAAFAFARAFARSRGYRLMVGGVTAAILPMLALRRLDVDIVQLRFGVDLPSSLPADCTYVLSNTHDAAALQWGQDRGIALFQGRILIRH